MIKYIDKYDGTSCSFCPNSNNLIGCSFSENFCFLGKGRVLLLNYSSSKLIPIKQYNFEKCISCIEFNKNNNPIIYSGDIEGKLVIINYKNNILFNKKIHLGNITSIKTEKLNNNLLFTASSDKTSKIIDINNFTEIYQIKNIFKKEITSISLDHKIPNILSLSSNDGLTILFDIRNRQKPIKCFQFNNPIMSTDFSYYDSNFLIGESNGSISLYDLRNYNNNAIQNYIGHSLANKMIKFSPFKKNIFGSCGYDMNINIWDISISVPLRTYKHHTEFVTGIDFGQKNKMISISFDKSFCFFDLDI